MDYSIVLLLSMVFLLFFSGYFSGSEAALFSLPATRLKSYQTDADPRRRLISSLLSRPRDLLVTIFILNTLVNILLQNVAANLFGEMAGWSLKVGVPLVLTLIFGEIIPKYIGLQNNTKFSYYVAPVISWLQRVLKPIRQMTIAITAPISRFMFFFVKKEDAVSKEEVQHILKASEESGVFNADEGEFITGYLKLQEASVKELMWPREDIIYYDINEPLTKLAYLFAEQELSRIPVCNVDLDHIMGIITAKKFLLHKNELLHSSDLKPLLFKPIYVPETTSARMLLKRFHSQQQVFALVVDEYGSISGLITREDLIEVVIGEISDKRNQKSLYTKAGPNEIIASGKLELAEFNDLFRVDLKSEFDMATIGGWLIEQVGEIPKSGSSYEIGPFLFQVLASSPNRIRRLYVRKHQKGKK